jgi:hypothetical protein
VVAICEINEVRVAKEEVWQMTAAAQANDRLLAKGAVQAADGERDCAEAADRGGRRG